MLNSRFLNALGLARVLAARCAFRVEGYWVLPNVALVFLLLLFYPRPVGKTHRRELDG